jgi:hypothetical protein
MECFHFPQAVSSHKIGPRTAISKPDVCIKGEEQMGPGCARFSSILVLMVATLHAMTPDAQDLASTRLFGVVCQVPIYSNAFHGMNDSADEVSGPGLRASSQIPMSMRRLLREIEPKAVGSEIVALRIKVGGLRSSGRTALGSASRIHTLYRLNC